MKLPVPIIGILLTLIDVAVSINQVVYHEAVYGMISIIIIKDLLLSGAHDGYHHRDRHSAPDDLYSPPL